VGVQRAKKVCCHSFTAIYGHNGVLSAGAGRIRVEKRNQGRYVLYNSDTSVIAILRALSHQETLARTDTETFAMSPLSPTTGNGLTLAQTSADTVVATQTGFTATLRYAWIPYEIGDKIGDSPEWAADVQPISVAGIPQGSKIMFPQMTLIKIMLDSTGNNATRIIDANASAPMYPGNTILLNNVTDNQGRITIVPGWPPRDYWTPYTTPDAKVANKTIMQRMWANSHIIYKMDKAYAGETCFPALICPYGAITSLFPQVPDKDIIAATLNMTHTGMHMRKIFWPVG
jgi:hypothetical protein